MSLTRNDQRRKDINAILQALASRFRNTRVHALPVNETPIELCVTPILKTSTTTASNGSLLLVTEESPCKEYIDIAYLSPSYLSTIPRDPTLATSSAQIGYMITRSESNDITITPKTLDDKAVIKVTCNFNAGCSSVEQISTTIYTQPYIISIDRPIFLRDATPKTSITIVGKGFTGKNAVTLTQRNNSKEYYLGEFISTNGTTTLLDPNSLNKKFPCGDGCTDGVPVGDYMVTIKNEGGVSNVGYISIKSYTTSTISSHGNSTVTPNSSSTKIGSITVSSDISLTLKSLTLTSTTTNKLLPLKITKLVLKDSQVNTAITSSGSTFTLPSIPLGANESKIFDIYADIGDVFIQEFGRMSYSGTILARDSLSGVDLEFSIKEFLFTVSY